MLLKSELDRIPNLGWTNTPTPVTEFNAFKDIAEKTWVGCKRDDLGTELNGGTKVRKLDFLLADPVYSKASAWTSVGAIGSGNLTACAAAASVAHKDFYPNLFWEPISEGVLDNLGHTLELSVKPYFYSSRLTMALCRPGLFCFNKVKGQTIIPIGSTCVKGMVGTVKAGLELAEQVRMGILPEPKELYVALGSGGTTVGLSVGLALGGLKTRIRAIAVVEHFFTSQRKLDRLTSALMGYLEEESIIRSRFLEPATIIIDRRELGAGYGITTKASLDSVALAKEQGVQIEPIYTGKAMAAMRKDLEQGINGPILFWNTMRGPIKSPAPGWQKRLPQWMKKKLPGQAA